MMLAGAVWIYVVRRRHGSLARVAVQRAADQTRVAEVVAVDSSDGRARRRRRRAPARWSSKQRRRSPPPAARRRAPTPRRWSPTRSGSASRSSRARRRRRAVARGRAPRSSGWSRRRAEHEPLAYILGREPLPRDRDRRRRAGADPAPRDRAAGRGRRRAARGRPRARGRHRLRRDRPGPAQRAPRPAGHRLGPLARGGRESPARTPSGSASTLEVTVDEGLPDALSTSRSTCVIANLPYVTDSTIYERSPEIQREPRIAVHRRLRRGRPRRDPRPDRRDPRAAGGSRFEHDTHHGPTMRELLRRGEHADRLHGRRAGDGRPRAMSDGEPARAEPSQGSTEDERRAKARAAARRRHRPLPARLPRPQQDRGDPRRARPRASSGRASTREFSYRIAGRRDRPARPRQDRLPRRPRPDRHDPGLRPRRRARRGGLRPDRGPRHRRRRRGRGRPLRDQARPAGAGGARVRRCWPRRCATRPTSSTASPTPRSATASASST